MLSKQLRQLVSIFTVTLLFCLTAQACSAPSNSSAQLTLTGSSTVAPLMQEIAERYQIDYPDVSIDIRTGGSNKGIEDARQGHNDIGMVSRALTPGESSLWVFTVARDGIGLLLHKDNPVAQLTDEQVRQIFTGQTVNWQQVGGNAAPIVVISKNANHATLGVFAKYFAIEPSEVEPDQAVGDNDEVLQVVKNNPDAIGYVSIGTAEYQIVHGLPLKLLPINGIAATVKNVREGVFPIARQLNLVTQVAPEEIAKDFIKFSQSSAVEDIIQEQAFVPPQ